MLSDADLELLFKNVDADGSGDVSIEELAEFVWGGQHGGHTGKVNAI